MRYSARSQRGALGTHLPGQFQCAAGGRSCAALADRAHSPIAPRWEAKLPSDVSQSSTLGTPQNRPSHEAQLPPANRRYEALSFVTRGKSKQLTISVNGQQKLSRNLAYWKFSNYFKAGCYPQTTEGTVDVMFRKLIAK